MKQFFQIEKSPKFGLLGVEWAALIYLLFTLVIMLFTYTKLNDPTEMLMGRARFVVLTAAAWGLYRMLPCRLTRLVRIVVQMVMLSWWYPDTYEFNRMFPNLDHVFADWEQAWFGCQPSLLFSQVCSHHIFSELMDLGYFIYYPLIAVVAFYFFFWKYDQFGMATFVIMASFFAYYIIYVLLPVTGPQYYFPAIGLDKAAAGVFPDVGNYFSTLRDAIESPGYKDGFFYQLGLDAHNAGERPTAAFPSSHIGISTILMLLARRSHKGLMFTLLPFYVLLCCATVYIKAHYLIDGIAGIASGIAIYALTTYLYKKSA